MLKQLLNKLIYLHRFLLIPTLFIIFSVVILLLYRDVKKLTIQDFNNEQLILARTASKGISSYFKDSEADLSFLSKLQSIIDNTDEGKEILQEYFESHQDVISAITRIDSNGTILSTFPHTPSTIGNNIAYQKHVQLIIETHEPVISDVFMALQGYLSIAYHVPVFNEGNFAGTLAILIPLHELGELYLANLKTRGTGEAWLLSENGTEIYCTTGTHTGKKYIENTLHYPAADSLLNLISRDSNGIVKSIHNAESDGQSTVYNEQYITFYRTPLGNTYWTILISTREADIYNALKRFRNRSLIIFLILLLSVAFYFYSLVQVRNVLRQEKKRRQVEKNLVHSEEKFRKLFEDHIAVKLIFDLKTMAIIDANKAAVNFYGWSHAELCQMKIQQINTLPIEIIAEEVSRFQKEGQTHYEWKHRLKNGKIRDVEVLSSKINIDGRDVIHSVVHDITERKKAEKELIIAKELAEENNRLKTAFLHNISHEIRTPMNAIMGFSSLMVDSYNNKEQLQQFSEIINQSCNNLLKIIDDILDIAKIESGQLTLQNETFNLNKLFTELQIFFIEYQRNLEKENIQFSIENFTGNSTTIIADKGKLQQILINLISNAFKFTEKGKIEVGCKVVGQQIEFYVSDTGTGIPAEKQEAIFERFTQLHNEKKVVFGGTGLGLSIVKGLINLLGGKLWLKSVPEDVQNNQAGGTTFYFTLPYTPGEQDQQD
ncbi:MAG TPA: ATP-binding protein, partial [Draconibacterium sp.]|nr:ATP-binding protein [Draconibacterium sp.]